MSWFWDGNDDENDEEQIAEQALFSSLARTRHRRRVQLISALNA